MDGVVDRSLKSNSGANVLDRGRIVAGLARSKLLVGGHLLNCRRCCYIAEVELRSICARR